MISLAPLRYRSVFAKDDGPIRSVVLSRTTLFGRPMAQANAWLEPSLVPPKEAVGLFGSADGTGTSASWRRARHVAISEALERWAYWSVSTSPDAERYGFRVDDSPTGMAAFPSLFKRAARRLAYLEALERWAVAAWWLGRLEAVPVNPSVPGVSVLRIAHERPEPVVIVFRRAPGGQTSYGCAAAASVRRATLHAAVEMARNEFVLAYAKVRGVAAAPRSVFERRCAYFASPEGHAAFLQRVLDRPRAPGARWAVRFDGEIPGPWARFTTVWRVVPAMPEGFAVDAEQFFAW